MALSYAFDANAGETPETLAARRRTADLIMSRMLGNAPRNLGEGLNALGQGWLAGRIRDDADERMAAGRATVPIDFAAMITGAGKAPAAALPMGALPGLAATPAPAPDTTGKIYVNDEPSPLDPPSGADRLNIIATILGEAGNEPQLGKEAVASVIRTRAVDGGYGGDTPTGVVTAKNQFEPWNTAEGRARMARAVADPKQYAAADAAIASAYGEGGRAPNDPTEGMTHFWSPKAQAALGRKPPSWAGGETVQIGGHVFNSPDDRLPANAQAAQGMLPTAPAPQPAKQAGGLSIQELMRHASNPWLNEAERGMVNMVLKQRMEQEAQAADPLRQAQIAVAQARAKRLFATGGEEPEYGLNPIYGKDADGNDVLGVIGKDGTFKKLDTGGVKISSGVEKIDLGTHYQLRDRRTGQIVGTEQKDLRGKARENEIGESQGKAIAAAPGDIQAGQNALNILDQIETSPYLSRGTGLTSLGNAVPGTGGYDFQNLVDQAKSGAFLQAIQQMRGLGSLSNAEGGAATAAITRMNTATSTEGFKKALSDYRTIVQQGIDRAKSRLANPDSVNPGALSASSAKTPSVDDLLKKYGR